MKLLDKFLVLQETAFGPWLAAFKKLFSAEELDQEILFITNISTHEKSLAIIDNNVIEIETDTQKIANEIIDKYKKNINLVFTKICNKGLSEYFNLITHLPSDFNNWNNYFEELEKVKGYDLLDAVKKVPNIDKLVEKFADSQNEIYRNHYIAIGESTGKLLEYIKGLEENILNEISLAGVEKIANSYIDYGCSGV